MLAATESLVGWSAPATPSADLSLADGHSPWLWTSEAAPGDWPSDVG
jgi:hypothetical protein